jgi:predicted small metal-binding protein
MTKSISCNFTGKDCSWSAESTRNDDEELMSMVREHVLAEHKEVELNPENIENIKSLIKVTKRFWWWG